MCRSSTSLPRQASFRIKHGITHADASDRQRLKGTDMSRCKTRLLPRYTAGHADHT